MKKSAMFLSIFLIHSAYGCQVILTNDSNTWVSVKDLREKSSFKAIGKGQSIKANDDPHQHAQLQVIIGPKGGNSPSSYLVKQNACSKNHVIPLSSSDIEQLKTGSLVTIEKIK